MLNNYKHLYIKTMIQLGLKVRDKITGLEGLATGKASYITGCDQYLLQPPAKDGNYISGTWIDEARIEIIGEGILPASVLGDKNGCDISAPVK